MEKPLLSIGIIFKNEIRCIERCLKSLQPLRDALPCELLMADTGADDGSREVAERYADILIDFPWINDFSAARNALMDRSSGKWHMVIDCDEWLDEEIRGYVAFLTTNEDFDFASVIVRNYDTLELDKGGSHGDFLSVRFVRMSTGIRYEGAVHEHWPTGDDFRTMLIQGAVFHHDGYVYQNKEKIQEKQKRNMELLRDKLAANPDDLIVLNQCVESSANMPEQEGYLRRALAGVNEKWSQWELFGAPIYRHAIRMAIRDELPEAEEWIEQAEAGFPNSIFLRVEIAYFAFGYYWNKDNYDRALYWGEKYLQGVKDYHAGNFDRVDLLASALDKTDTHSHLSVAVVLASGYLDEKQPERCVQIMESLDPSEMNTKQIVDSLRNFSRLRREFDVDTDKLILSYWERLDNPKKDDKKGIERLNAWVQIGGSTFSREVYEEERANPAFRVCSYTIFLPLLGKSELGRAASVMEMRDTVQIQAALAQVELWDQFPIQALSHAMEHGVRFPLPGKNLNIEEMDRLASRLAGDKERFFPLVLRITQGGVPEDWQPLCWLRGLLMAAVQIFPWSDKEVNEKQGMAIARAFAQVEREFLPRCYSADALQEDRLFVLPPLHRFGWYCAQAFQALEQGSAVEYVRLLRCGLDTCEGMKNIVEFLADHTQEVQMSLTTPELRALADQVRVILARFDPDDPAVGELKRTDAYQKVAHLIEGTAVPVWGGQPQ